MRFRLGCWEVAPATDLLCSVRALLAEGRGPTVRGPGRPGGGEALRLRNVPYVRVPVLGLNLKLAAASV